MMIGARNSLVLAFDNLSGLAPWAADALCRLATGGGYSTRTLYENDEETLFDSMCPTIVNGIDDLAVRDDLRDRSVVLTLPTIRADQRRDERSFWKDFEQARPKILGALLTGVSGAMAQINDMDPQELPRMADFALWSMAAEEALGWPRGAFRTAFGANQAHAAQGGLEGDPLAEVLLDLVPVGWKSFTAKELLTVLGADASIEESYRRSHAWPRSPRALSNRLRRIAPTLRRFGLEVRTGREGHDRRRIITLERTGNSPAVSSASAAIRDGEGQGGYG